jgi:hypothetical protein|tara:strand:+ start:317 stop:472 length:156 start_codon:yes stop_codon:yes gene_type:complete
MDNGCKKGVVVLADTNGGRELTTLNDKKRLEKWCQKKEEEDVCFLFRVLKG